jgi:hypothetical protein
MNRHQVILACAGLVIAGIIIILGGFDCFVFSIGLLLVPIGFGTMLAGRMWRIASRYKQNQSGMNRTALTILVGAAMFFGGFAIIYLVVKFTRPE